MNCNALAERQKKKMILFREEMSDFWIFLTSQISEKRYRRLLLRILVYREEVWNHCFQLKAAWTDSQVEIAQPC